MTLHRDGWSSTAISRQLGLSRPTVRTYVRAEAFPEWAPRRTLFAGSPNTVYLQERWAEGCRDARTVWQELQARGFTGSLRVVQRAVADWREMPGRRGRQATVPATAQRGALPRPRSLSARQALWLLLRPEEELTVEEGRIRSRLLGGATEIRTAFTLIESFRVVN